MSIKYICGTGENILAKAVRCTLLQQIKVLKLHAYEL